MSTLTLLALLAGATLAGATLGACALKAWHRLHQPEEIARLTAANIGLAHEVEEWRARCWRAEHIASLFVGLRDTSIIAVDLRRPNDAA